MTERGRRRPTTAWLLIRTTAVVLVALVLAHFALTHFITDVAATDSTFVAARWESGLVAAADWVMLVAAVLHGCAGAWTIADDHLATGGRRRLVRGGIVGLGVTMVVVGSVTLLVVLGRSPVG